MMKKLLTAAFAVAALSLVPSAEARCGRKCAPKAESCEKSCAPACTTDVQVVGQKYFPCCRMVKEIGYQKCPVKETTTCCTKRSTRCCPEEKSCCLYPGDAGFVQAELDEAHGNSRVASSSADVE